MSSDPRNRVTGATAPRRAGPDRRRELGRQGEQLACARLAEAGLLVVARNWRCRLGEIDVIAAVPGLLVFCEVKTRRGDAYGTAAAAVTPIKQARLRRLAAAYLTSVEQAPCRVRFDVIAVNWPRGGSPPTLEHLATRARGHQSGRAAPRRAGGVLPMPAHPSADPEWQSLGGEERHCRDSPTKPSSSRATSRSL